MFASSWRSVAWLWTGGPGILVPRRQTFASGHLFVALHGRGGAS
jgi:hypothetical protein